MLIYADIILFFGGLMMQARIVTDITCVPLIILLREASVTEKSRILQGPREEATPKTTKFKI